jgi:uncharacterized membrane protein
MWPGALQYEGTVAPLMYDALLIHARSTAEHIVWANHSMLVYIALDPTMLTLTHVAHSSSTCVAGGVLLIVLLCTCYLILSASVHAILRRKQACATAGSTAHHAEEHGTM